MKKIVFGIFAAASIAIFALAFWQVSVAAKTSDLTKTFAKIGYQVKSSSGEQTPTAWEKEQFQMLKKRAFSVKRLKPMGKQRDLFPRFDVVEEVYADEQKAAARAARVNEKPPDADIYLYKEFVMVTGFRHKEKVYFIGTDAVIFYEEEMPDFAAQLKTQLEKNSKTYNKNSLPELRNVTLSQNEIIADCSETASQSSQNRSNNNRIIKVSLDVLKLETDEPLCHYFVSGGKIIGSGENVEWDLTTAKPGVYKITAGIYDECGVCDPPMTREVNVKECRESQP